MPKPLMGAITMGLELPILLTEWGTLSDIINPDELYFKKAAQYQVEAFLEISNVLELAGTIVSTHQSKSCVLPVVQWESKYGKVQIRNNFYDCNIAFEGTPRALTWEDLFFVRRDWEWYLSEVAKCEGYTWKGWSGAELNDPRITRVLVTRDADHGGGTYWSEVTIGRKERWLSRFQNFDWLDDWGHRPLALEGTFGPECTIWEGYTPFQQGLTIGRYNERPVTPAMSSFVVAGPMENARVINLIRLLLCEA